MKYFLPIIAFLVLTSINLPESGEQKIIFKTKNGDVITITGIQIDKYFSNQYKIHYNQKLIYSKSETSFMFYGEHNKLIEENGKLILFMESKGGPGLDHIITFYVTPDTVKQITDDVFNPQNWITCADGISDMDNDGNIEFGGFDINEVPGCGWYYQYYRLSKYYEIIKGEIKIDSAYSRQMDIAHNGFYEKDSGVSKYYYDFKGWGMVVKTPVPNCGGEKAIAIQYQKGSFAPYLEKIKDPFGTDSLEVIYFSLDSIGKQPNCENNKRWYCKTSKKRIR